VLQAMIHCTLCVKRMHDLSWCHRDLKPSNVLRIPRTHTWTLIDFGSAARIGERLFCLVQARMLTALREPAFRQEHGWCIACPSCRHIRDDLESSDQGHH
jgi:serine/threonine protein kinase